MTTRKRFEPGQAVEIRGAWTGAPWRKAHFSFEDGDDYAALANDGTMHYVTADRIRPRKTERR